MKIIKLTEETRKEALEKLIGRSPAGYPEQEKAVSEIIEAVRTRGDQAVLDYEEKFDRCKMTADQLRVTPEEIREAYESLDPAFVEVMRRAAESVSITRSRRSTAGSRPVRTASSWDRRSPRSRCRAVMCPAAGRSIPPAF